jgi:hypothetical protein
MAQKKYGHWIKPIPSFRDYGQGQYRQGTEMDRKFFGFDLHVKLGTFYNSCNMEPFQTQVCDYDQIMVWMGTDRTGRVLHRRGKRQAPHYNFNGRFHS